LYRFEHCLDCSRVRLCDVDRADVFESEHVSAEEQAATVEKQRNMVGGVTGRMYHMQRIVSEIDAFTMREMTIDLEWPWYQRQPSLLLGQSPVSSNRMCPDFAPQLLFQCGGRTDMVGMGMRDNERPDGCSSEFVLDSPGSIFGVTRMTGVNDDCAVLRIEHIHIAAQP